MHPIQIYAVAAGGTFSLLALVHLFPYVIPLLVSPYLSQTISRTHTSFIDTTSLGHGPERALPCSTLPRSQRILYRRLRLVVARSQSIHIRRGWSSSKYPRNGKHDSPLRGVASRLPCGLARAPPQDHPWHPPVSRADDVRDTPPPYDD